MALQIFFDRYHSMDIVLLGHINTFQSPPQSPAVAAVVAVAVVAAAVAAVAVVVAVATAVVVAPLPTLLVLTFPAFFLAPVDINRTSNSLRFSYWKQKYKKTQWREVVSSVADPDDFNPDPPFLKQPDVALDPIHN
jgi:fatty acid desaturase